MQQYLLVRQHCPHPQNRSLLCLLRRAGPQKAPQWSFSAGHSSLTQPALRLRQTDCSQAQTPTASAARCCRHRQPIPAPGALVTLFIPYSHWPQKRGEKNHLLRALSTQYFRAWAPPFSATPWPAGSGWSRPPGREAGGGPGEGTGLGAAPQAPGSLYSQPNSLEDATH